MFYKYPFQINTLSGNPLDLSQLKGKVLLFVNVASECGYTKQYSELQQLYLKYKDEGLEVLGFPCNQFGEQEPGSSDEILEFTSSTFGVTFTLTEKINVKGKNAHPIFRWILMTNNFSKDENSVFDWNFTKFLINKQGKLCYRYDHKTTPLSFDEDIQKLLKE